ncbi:MAG: M20/M25/M40 family metallo-hydrolase [Puniceicoccales bacterium]|jgi:endoglucanase|nr:M20/M25/M40 family metallo-hydrolase [Puniceicoccales bacterium]
MLSIPKFLKELMIARSPSGYEFEAQKVIDHYMENAVDTYKKDTIGNRFATVKTDENHPTCMLSGHMDELGFAITYIDDKGFLSFSAIGGHDRGIIPGRRVQILTKNGDVLGITGKRAIHLLDDDEENKVQKLHELWIDIGVKSEAEAKALVCIGDPVVYETPETAIINGTNNVTGRAFDDKAGAYVVMEAALRLAAEKDGLRCNVVAVASAQEEVGTRGAINAAYSCMPAVGIAVDVGHATDFPNCDNKRFAKIELGAGPIVTRGVNINPLIFERIIGSAERENIPYQIEAETRPTGTDARCMQVSRGGVPTGLISIPLRYMHTPVETANLEDIENAIKLICAFVRSLKPDDRFEF